jgi:hypothetical protein
VVDVTTGTSLEAGEEMFEATVFVVAVLVATGVASGAKEATLADRDGVATSAKAPAPRSSATTTRPTVIDRIGRSDSHEFHRNGFSTTRRLASASVKLITMMTSRPDQSGLP